MCYKLPLELWVPLQRVDVHFPAHLAPLTFQALGLDFTGGAGVQRLAELMIFFLVRWFFNLGPIGFMILVESVGFKV